MIQESDGRALKMSRIGRPVAVPRRIHTFRAAPFAQVALAEITAVCVGIGNSRIIGVVLILVLVLVFIFLTVPGRNRCRHVLRFGIMVLDRIRRNRTGIINIGKSRGRNQGMDAVLKAVTDFVRIIRCGSVRFLLGFVLFLDLCHNGNGRRYRFRFLDLCCRSSDSSHKTAKKQDCDDRLLH